MIVLAFAASEIFRIFFRMFLGIVGFGLIHGLCIMPVYMSLLCCKSEITTSISVRVRVERQSSFNKRDESSNDLKLADTGNKYPDLGADNPSLQWAEEENVDEEAVKEKQEDDGIDYDQYIVNVFKEIHNEGLETDDEKPDASTGLTGEENKQSLSVQMPDAEKNAEIHNEGLETDDEKPDVSTGLTGEENKQSLSIQKPDGEKNAGIHNEGLETGDEKPHVSTGLTGEESKQSLSSEKPDGKKNVGTIETTQASERSDILADVTKL